MTEPELAQGGFVTTDLIRRGVRRVSSIVRSRYQRAAARARLLRQDAALSSIVAEERPRLIQARSTFAAMYKDAQPSPLVTVVITTYNRSDLLLSRSVPSALAQTYGNLEVIVVGDGCTDDTEARMSSLNDPRVRFVNLPERSKYPDDPLKRWLVQSTIPLNNGFGLAKGQWLAQLDDDDEFTPDHVEVLLRHAVEHDLEISYGVCSREWRPGEWSDRGSERFDLGILLPSASIQRTYLKLFTCDPESWRLGMCWDKHRWRRMYRSGVQTGFLNKVVTRSPLRPGTTRLDYLAEDRR